MTTIYQHHMKSPLGKIGLYGTDEYLMALTIGDSVGKEGSLYSKLEDVPTKKVASLALAEKELDLYFRKKLELFTVPVELQGTAFQKKVWRQLQKIPFGKLRGYLEHAKAIGKPESVRAASAAIGSNPISIVVPCHRVIGKNRKLTGFAFGLDVKQWLLEHEGHRVENEKVL
jgi:methylated-DNA-[protein]-cysteine S-methyltransferase